MVTTNDHVHIVPLNDSFDFNIFSYIIVIITGMMPLKLSIGFWWLISAVSFRIISPVSYIVEVRFLVSIF